MTAHETQMSEEAAPRRMLSRALLFALICSTALFAESRNAVAFEIFGIRLWGSSNDQDADIVDPLRYAVTIVAPDADRALLKNLENASTLKADEERPVSGSLGLLAKARSDREQLVAALFADARYDGVVTITIQGKSLDELPPDAEFSGPQPIPVVIDIAAGQKFTLGNIRLEGDAAGLMSADFGLIAGGDASSGAVLKAEAQIVRALKQEGRPLARITDRQIVADHDTTTLDVTLTVAAGPVAGYGDTTVEGTEKVDRDFTEYMTGLKRGRRYSPDEIDDARDRLLGLEVFNSVTLKEADKLDPNGNIPIDVKVSERKRRYFGIGGTASSTEGLGLESTSLRYHDHALDDANIYGHTPTMATIDTRTVATRPLLYRRRGPARVATSAWSATASSQEFFPDTEPARQSDPRGRARSSRSSGHLKRSAPFSARTRTISSSSRCAPI